jgi:hypothetical protein
MTHNIRVISDLEGFDIEMYFHNTYDLFVCGDILDSTLVTAMKGKFLELKSNNLKNILHCACNPNVRLLFGNRDLNKLKCKYLAELNHAGEHTENFNNGNIELSFESYNVLKEKINKEQVWKVSDMNAWYTFWADVGKGKNWTVKSNYLEQPFYARFLEVFGADNAEKDGGTMSAQNLLQTIPYEIGIEHDNNDYKAFIVLAIFKSMLTTIEQPVRLSDIEPIKEAKTSDAFKGWLYQMYIRKDNNLCCFLDYGIDQNKENNFMYLFSHGGLSHRLIENPELFNEIITYLNSSSELTGLLTDASAYYDVFKKGGYYKKNQENLNLLSREQIISSVSILNSIVKDNINVVLENDKEWEIENDDSEKSSSVDESSQNVSQSSDNSSQNVSESSGDEDSQMKESVVEGSQSKSDDDNSDESSTDICSGKSREECPNPPKCHWKQQKCQKGGASTEQPTLNMLFLLIISSGFSLLNFVKKINDMKVKETILNSIIPDKSRQNIENLNDLFPSSTEISPLSTGFKTIRKDTPFLKSSYVQLVQFIGHSPNGFGATVDKCETLLTENSMAKTYIVNLDSSNTFYGSNLNNIDSEIKSKSYCEFKNNHHVKINTTLVLNLGSDPTKSLVHVKFTDQTVSNYKSNDTHKYITDHDLPSIPLLEITSVLGSHLLDEQIEFSNENNINIHGFCNILDEDRIVFSVNESENSRNKNLYCLNFSNYKKFLEISE